MNDKQMRRARRRKDDDPIAARARQDKLNAEHRLRYHVDPAFRAKKQASCSKGQQKVWGLQRKERFAKATEILKQLLWP